MSIADDARPDQGEPVAGGYSYNGWPASDNASAIGVNTSWTPLPGITFPGGIKGGDVEVVFTYLVVELNKIEACIKGWNWGWSYRANVNNPSQLSCHASATAIDYNAPNHPNGTSTGPNGGGGWSSTEYSKVQKVLSYLEGVVSWLTGNDPMHFEIEGSAADVKRVADKIRNLEDDVALSDADKDWIKSTFAEELNKILYVSTDDAVADGNPNKYTLASGISRIVRLTSLTYAKVTGQDPR